MRKALSTASVPLAVFGFGSVSTGMPKMVATADARPCVSELDMYLVLVDTLHDVLRLDGGHRQQLGGTDHNITLEAPPHFPAGTLVAGGALDGHMPAAWRERVVGSYGPGVTELDITTTTLWTQLHRLAMRGDLTAYDILSSPLYCPAAPAWSGPTAAVRALLPRLVTSGALERAVHRGVGILSSELRRVRTRKGGVEADAAASAPIPPSEHFAMAKYTCFGFWTMLRALVHVLPPPQPDEDLHTMRGLLHFAAREAPALWCPRTADIADAIAAITGASLTLSDVEQGAAAVGAAVASDCFPLLPWLEAVVAVRELRGAAPVPPLFCQVFLFAIIRVVAQSAHSMLKAADRHPATIPDATLQEATALLVRICMAAEAHDSAAPNSMDRE